MDFNPKIYTIMKKKICRKPEKSQNTNDPVEGEREQEKNAQPIINLIHFQEIHKFQLNLL